LDDLDHADQADGFNRAMMSATWAPGGSGGEGADLRACGHDELGTMNL
jgi:hypothetical protein